MLKSIDKRYEAMFTRLSHWFQRLTGMTSYRQAYHAAIITAMGTMFHAADCWIQGVFYSETSMMFVGWAAIGVPIWILAAMLCDHFDKEFRLHPQVPPDTGSPSHPFIRLASVVLAFLAIGETIALYWAGKAGFLEFVYPLHLTAFALFWYLCDIVPLPPGESKVKSWLKSWRFSPQLSPQEAGNR